MAEDRSESREASWQTLAPFTELFRAFQIALDLNKMFLAAAGILVMTIGWSLLSLAFSFGYEKEAPDWSKKPDEKTAETYSAHHQERLRWNLMHEAAGLGAPDSRFEVEDFAQTLREYETASEIFKDFDPLKTDRSAVVLYRDALTDRIKAAKDKLEKSELEALVTRSGRYADLGKVKPYARLAVWPWFEDRGPNPYLLVTGQAGIPWEAGYFWDWFTRSQLPVMVEPLIKFVRPIVYFLSPDNTFTSRIYFLLAALVMLVTWSIFGGAITRIAAVQYATRGERIGALEALRFTTRRLGDYILAPLFPLGFVFVLVLFSVLPYFIVMIPVVGDFFAGLLWPLWLTFGVIMAVALVGLVGWPLMAATISTEGTDSWEAVSRTYSYVYQRPWHFVWYALVSIAYGGAVVFFVGFMASFAVYLAKWATTNTPGSTYFNREPLPLFIYAPTSFGWRELLLEGAMAKGVDTKGKEVRPLRPVVEPRSTRRDDRIDPVALKDFKDSLAWWNFMGAGMVGFWLALAFLLMLGFGYSFFWTASTIIYFLLRKSVDTNDLDDVYQEEEDYQPRYSAPPPSPAAPTAPVPATLPMVPPTPAAPTEAPAPAPAPATEPTPPPEPKPEPTPPPEPPPSASEEPKKDDTNP
jgi:hypothetical protein